MKHQARFAQLVESPDRIPSDKKCFPTYGCIRYLNQLQRRTILVLDNRLRDNLVMHVPRTTKASQTYQPHSVGEEEQGIQ
jgi:hypothetical protein